MQDMDSAFVSAQYIYPTLYLQTFLLVSTVAHSIVLNLEGNNCLIPMDGLETSNLNTAVNSYVIIDFIIDHLEKQRQIESIPIICILDCCCPCASEENCSNIEISQGNTSNTFIIC